MKAGGSLKPASIETVTKKEHFAYQEGQAVFKFAVKGMADVTAELLERNKLTGDDIAWLVPHQANLRIIDATASRIGLVKRKSNDQYTAVWQHYCSNYSALFMGLGKAIEERR